MATTTKEPQLPSIVKGTAGNIYVSDGGAGGLPVIFLHSFGGNSHQWDAQLEHLRSNMRAIAIDLRGHGNSDAPSDMDYTIKTQAEDISAVADSLRLKHFILVGHSMGGSSAIAFASNHPDRVAGLLLTGTPGKVPPEQASQVVSSLQSDKYQMVMDEYMKKLLENASPATTKSEMDGMKKLSKETSIAIIKANFEYDPVNDLHNYPGPKMIISRKGEDQPGSLHAQFPSIPYKTVEGTSHWIQMDKPGEFNSLLDDFIETAKKNANDSSGLK